MVFYFLRTLLMNKKLLAVAVSIFTLTGIAFASQILETTPSTNTTKPIVRPSLTKTLDKRPVLPAKGTAGTGTANTGAVAHTGVQTVVQQVKQQNAQDVADYRAENGYITRYLMKPTTADAKKAMASTIESAIKTLLAAQKTMSQTYQTAAKTTTLMTKEQWNALADAAVAAYRTAILPYIDTAKTADFEKFIL